MVRVGNRFRTFSLLILIVILFILLKVVIFSKKEKVQNNIGVYFDVAAESDFHKNLTSLLQYTLKINSNREKFGSQCEYGHIRNLPPICGKGCLRVLPPLKHSTPVDPVTPEWREIFIKTEGMMHEPHIDLVYYLSKAQREFGIYGSVGEIGVFEGKFFSVMANWLDPEAGERLFICDIFGEAEHMKLKTYQPRSYMVERNLNRLNYSFFSKDEKRRIRLYQTSSLYLSKTVLQRPDLEVPAFRIFSVDGNHNYPFVLYDILTASCILRDGGILALDDVRNLEWPQIDVSLIEFFTHYGKDIFRPILQYELKMYLVTANWYDKYMEWIEKNDIPKILNLEKESSEYYNVSGYFYMYQKDKQYQIKPVMHGSNADKRHEVIHFEE